MLTDSRFALFIFGLFNASRFHHSKQRVVAIKVREIVRLLISVWNPWSLDSACFKFKVFENLLIKADGFDQIVPLRTIQLFQPDVLGALISAEHKFFHLDLSLLLLLALSVIDRLFDAVYHGEFVGVLFGDDLGLFEIDLDPAWEQVGNRVLLLLRVAHVALRLVLVKVVLIEAIMDAFRAVEDVLVRVYKIRVFVI